MDVTQQINAVRRTVAGRVIEAGEGRVVTISQSYRATVADLWDACTNPQRLPRWFLPVTGDLRLGGRYQLEGNAGGTITGCDPPTSFAATWEYADQVSWIEVRLAPESPERTRLELEHLALVDEHWEQFGPGAAGIGWELGLLGLAQHLESAQPLDPAAAQAWLASVEGQEFVRLCGERWGQAEVASGVEESVAMAAAARCIAFYTGAEQPAS